MLSSGGEMGGTLPGPPREALAVFLVDLRVG